MRTFALFAALMGSAFAAPSMLSEPLQVRKALSRGYSVASPKDAGSIILSEHNTLNGTTENDGSTFSAKTMKANSDVVTGSLDLALVNNFGGGAINAYIQGLDSNGAVVFIKADGSLIYPTAGGSTSPVQITDPIGIPLGGQGSTTNVNVPISLTSGRIYFAEGDLPFFMVNVDGLDGVVQPSVSNLDDPSADLNWGFVELSYTTELAIYANISYVDFIGLILSMKLDNTDGSSQQTIGLDGNAVSEVCDGLTTQNGVDSQPWNKLCITNKAGVLNRIISPGNIGGIDNGAFSDYWDQYASDVWTKYTSEPLTINTQTSNGSSVACQVSGDQLTCAGDNRGYSKPTAADIWGCNSGPFGIEQDDNDIHKAIVPRLCAAFTRTELLLDGGNVTPKLDASQYYTVAPTNYYAALIHSKEVDGRGYAFPYDDVNPSNSDDASGLVSSGDPKTLSVYVGGMPSS